MVWCVEKEGEKTNRESFARCSTEEKNKNEVWAGENVPGAPTENMDTIILRGINLNTPTNGFLGTINLW